MKDLEGLKEFRRKGIQNQPRAFSGGSTTNPEPVVGGGGEGGGGGGGAPRGGPSGGSPGPPWCPPGSLSVRRLRFGRGILRGSSGGSQDPQVALYPKLTK